MRKFEILLVVIRQRTQIKKEERKEEETVEKNSFELSKAEEQFILEIIRIIE